MEACGLRDSFKEIEKLNAVILGVSPDSVKSHGKFISKFQLPFTLLADEDKKMCQDYGVWVEKSMYGKKYMGVARTTFIIDTNGNIARVFEKVKPEGHNQRSLPPLSLMNLIKTVKLRGSCRVSLFLGGIILGLSKADQVFRQSAWFRPRHASSSEADKADL